MGNKNKILTGKRNRNKILKANMQSHIKLKLISNSNNIDLNKRIYLERYTYIGLSTYIKVKHDFHIKRSNISEISDLDDNILWRREEKKNNKK